MSERTEPANGRMSETATCADHRLAASPPRPLAGLLGDGADEEILDEVEEYRRQLAHDLRRARARDQQRNGGGIIEV